MRSLLAALSIGVSPAPAPLAPSRADSLSPAPLAAPAVPGPSLAPAVAVPQAPAPDARAALAAAAALPVQLAPSAPSEAARASAGSVFGEEPARPSASAYDEGPRRSPYRLAPLGFGDLEREVGDGAPPPPPRPEPKPFLLRHYRLARFVAAPFVRLAYAVRGHGTSHLPSGPALIVPNHVSYMDPVLLSLVANRPMRFLMIRDIYETPGLEWLFRALGAIPISPRDPKDVIEESLYRARRALAAGETVVVFPEGRLSPDGNFSVFRRGFERVAAGTGAPVIPAHIDGMWGSAFSRRPSSSFLRGLTARLRGRRRVSVSFGPPLARPDVELARAAVARLVPPR